MRENEGKGEGVDGKEGEREVESRRLCTYLDVCVCVCVIVCECSVQQVGGSVRTNKRPDIYVEESETNHEESCDIARMKHPLSVLHTCVYKFCCLFYCSPLIYVF